MNRHWVTVVSVAAILVVSCGGGPTAPSAANGAPYTVGYIGSLTGSLASDWTSHKDGVNGYFYYTNQHGGVNGHPVNLVVRDDGSTDVAKAQTAFVEMRDQIKPSAILGLGSSATAEPLVPQLNVAQIPLISTGIAASDLKYPYMYIGSFLFASEGATQVEFVKTLATAGSIPKIALLTAGSPAGEGFKAQVEKSMKAEGWGAPVYEQALPVAQPLTDLLPQARQIVTAKADYVLGTIFTVYPVPLMRALAQVGFNGKVVTNFAGGNSNLLAQVNNPDFYTTQGFNYLKPGSKADVKTIVDSVQAAGGTTTGNDILQATGWVGGALVVAALKKCGYPCPGPKMKEALDSIGLIGDPQNAAAAPVGLTATDHIAVKSEVVYHFVNGQTEAVTGALALPTIAPQ